MQAKLAHVIGISPNHVGIKATTTEHLGFVGKKEGIAAWACVLLDDSQVGDCDAHLQ